MGDIEAIGDAITGSVLGRAVEPGAGEREGHTQESACLNCGSMLAGPYCAQCGQHAHVHRTLGAFFHDFAHGVLHFEGKIWRTIPMLALHPGELTRRYIEGQRARFVSPIALFLFCVFITFAVVGLTTNRSTAMQETRSSAAKSVANDQRKLAALQQQRASATGEEASKLDEKIADLKDDITTGQAIADGKVDGTIQLADDFLGGLGGAVNKAAKNPELLFYKLKTDAYKFSWALIPISVPFVWLLFPFSRRFRLYDHTVFVTYSLCFMLLLLSVSSIVGLVSSSLASLAWFLPPVHMYRQLRGAYEVGRAGAFWRTILLTIFAFMSASLFVSLLVTLGALD